MTEQEIKMMGEWGDAILTHGSRRHKMFRELVSLARAGAILKAADVEDCEDPECPMCLAIRQAKS